MQSKKENRNKILERLKKLTPLASEANIVYDLIDEQVYQVDDIIVDYQVSSRNVTSVLKGKSLRKLKKQMIVKKIFYICHKNV